MILDIVLHVGRLGHACWLPWQRIMVLDLRAYATKFGGKGTTFYDTCHYFEKKKN
jgi:hypothetical protein